MMTGIKSVEDLNKQSTAEMTKQVTKNAMDKAQKKANLSQLFSSSEPLAVIQKEIGNKEDEIPEELPAVEEAMDKPVLHEKQQAKADKKKQAKLNAKLKAA